MDVVEPATFWKLRSSVPSDPALVTLLAQLRAGQVTAATEERSQSHHRHKSAIGGANGGAKVEKDFIALMNKLSVQNVAAIEAQLWRFFQPLLFTFYTNHLWTLMYRQATFNALYVAMLRQVHDRLGEDDRAKLRAVMRGHADAFIRDFAASLAPMVLPAGEDYDEFCDAVKLKKQSVGKVAALCAMAKAGLLEGLSPAVALRFLADERPRPGDGEKVSIWTDHVTAALAELAWAPADAAPLLTAVRTLQDSGGLTSSKARFRVADLVERLGASPSTPPAAAQAAQASRAPHSRNPPRHGGGGQHQHPPSQHSQHSQPSPPSSSAASAASAASGDWREAKRRGGRGK